MSPYRLGSIERELEVYPGDGPQRVAAWRPKDGFRWRSADDYRRHAAEILPDDHSKADPKLCPLTGPLPMRLLVHFSVWAEAFVLPGKANGCAPRHAADGVRMLILHRV